MLQRFLGLLEDGAVRTQRELAEALGASESLVILAAEQLARRGYLVEANQCVSGCERCPMSQACGRGKDLRMWMLTDKGKAATRNPSKLNLQGF
ncbi:MAG: hypothetical protein ACLFTI_01145 [Anaerolineales bacterium]